MINIWINNNKTYSTSHWWFSLVFSCSFVKYVIANYCYVTVYNMAVGFVLLRLSITLYSQSEAGCFILNSFSCQIALEMAFLWRTLVTFKMVSRLALSAATRSLPSAKNKREHKNGWVHSFFGCQTVFKFSLKEVNKGKNIRTFHWCLVWYYRV